MKLLHIGITAGEGRWISREFSRRFDYREIRADEPQHKIKELFDAHRPDIVFLQVQRPGFPLHLLAYMNERAFVLNWCGDVREPLPDFYRDYAKYSTMAFSNVDDCKELGCEFLQIGIDPEIFKRWEGIRGADIVFMGNYSNCFPLSSYRMDMTQKLKKRYGNRFKIFGNWPGASGNFNNDQLAEARFYSGSRIAISISHFDRGRYFSDRLIRAMGSGCFTLSHHYEGIELDFDYHKHLDTFYTLNELVQKIDYYLEHDAERVMRSIAGYRHVHENFTTKNMIDDILRIYENKSLAKLV